MNFLRQFGQTLLIASCLSALPACSPFDSQPGYHGSVVKDKAQRDFFLIDHLGHSRHMQDYRGKVVVVFFGYTHCPDICPTTLSQLAAALRQLGPEAGRVQALFVTLDPEHDTASVLADYLHSFHPDFIGLTGSRENILAAARAFGIYYLQTAHPSTEPVAESTGHAAEPATAAPNHDAHAPHTGTAPLRLEHTTNGLVFDAGGHLRLIFKATQEADEIAADLRRLLADSAASRQ